MNTLFKIRYYLEIIALPAFIYLVTHLSGHGLALLIEGHHEHGHGGHAGEHHGFLETFFTPEILSGILALILFVWLWHRPSLKKWVPCGHDHCHGELPVSHVLATIALCLHFFPEASIRHELMHHAEDTMSVLGLIGFGTHFLVDIIVAIALSSYWKTTYAFWLSLIAIAGVWVLAFFSADFLVAQIPETAEGILFIVSAFLLAMFVHKPHKPVECKECK